MSKEKLLCRFYLLVGILTNTLPRYADFGTILGRKVYYVGQALSFVLILLAAKINPKDHITNIIFQLTLWLALNNLLDELLFDPLKLGWNELIFAIGISFWALFKIFPKQEQE